MNFTLMLKSSDENETGESLVVQQVTRPEA
jgi:hypothetical protein